MTIAALMILCISAYAQRNVKPNASVTRSFGREFKATTHERWEKISPDLFLVMFDDDKPNSIAYFNKDGELLLKGQAVSINKTPDVVQRAIKEAIKPLEEKKGTMNIILAYQILENGVTKYYANCGNDKFLMSVISSKKGKVKVLRQIDIDPDKTFLQQQISVL